MQQQEQEQQQNSLNHEITGGSKEHSLKILVTGASGFIGSRLVSRLYSSSSETNKREITCITRNVESLVGRFNEQVKIIKADASNYLELLRAMTGIDVAFYLIHSME